MSLSFLAAMYDSNLLRRRRAAFTLKVLHERMIAALGFSTNLICLVVGPELLQIPPVVNTDYWFPNSKVQCFCSFTVLLIQRYPLLAFIRDQARFLSLPADAIVLEVDSNLLTGLLWAPLFPVLFVVTLGMGHAVGQPMCKPVAIIFLHHFQWAVGLSSTRLLASLVNALLQPFRWIDVVRWP